MTLRTLERSRNRARLEVDLPVCPACEQVGKIAGPVLRHVEPLRDTGQQQALREAAIKAAQKAAA